MCICIYSICFCIDSLTVYTCVLLIFCLNTYRHLTVLPHIQYLQTCVSQVVICTNMVRLGKADNLWGSPRRKKKTLSLLLLQYAVHMLWNIECKYFKTIECIPCRDCHFKTKRWLSSSSLILTYLVATSFPD